MKIWAVLVTCVAVTMVTSEDVSDIKPCLRGKDVVVITDVRAAGVGQVLELLNFFERMARSLEGDKTHYYILSYPYVYYNQRTGDAITTSHSIHLINQIRSAQDFIGKCIVERGDHPDINVALNGALNLLNHSKTMRRNADKVVLIFSFDKYVSPYSSEEKSEEALETPSKVQMAKYGDSLKKEAQVLMYAIGGFDNVYGLFDLASCRDERCLFKIDDFDQLSKEPLFKGCQ